MVLDQFSTGVVISLIANGITSLLSYSAELGKDIISKHRDNVRKYLEADTDLIENIQNVMKEVVTTSILPSDKSQAVMIQQFLESPTAETIVRQIYSDFLPNIASKKQKNIKDIQEEFQICLARHLGVDKDEVKQIAADLFQLISMGCREALSRAIDQGVLSAHEAKSVARYRVVLNELEAINHTLNFFMSHPDLDLNAIKKFEDKYRSQVLQRSQKITIPNFDKAPKIGIDKIFVPPNFVYAFSKKRTEPKIVTMKDFLTHFYRVVVLGDPGGGKSTLAQEICYKLSKNYEKRIIGGRLLTPVLVVLREYSSKKKEGVSIVQFMESEATSKYQLSQIPPGTFEYLLNNGHLLVVFDGLDELLDTSHRRGISADIESFCNLFPSVPVLVTSRTVGYEQAPLDPELFEKFNMAPFDDKQVSDYAEKWFSNDLSLTPDDSKRQAEAFLEESHIVPDLRSNPLMLALMCNLYRGTGFIPRNRPEVYKKCSEMLFERWDTSRGIGVHPPLSEPKFLISHLANWIYSDESLQNGVPEDLLIREASNFLTPHRFDSEEEAEKASKEFLDFCRGRAWIFTDVGTTPKGIPLYKFTHKTFLEYFTAVNIVRNNNTPKELWNLLDPKIANRSWDVVAQLAFQLLHEQVEGASDKILNFLIEDAQKEKVTSWPYLSFGVRCLQFIYPSPDTLRTLTKAAIRCVIEGNFPLYYRKDLSHRFYRSVADALIRDLLSTAPENRQIVADCLQSEIVNYAKNGDDKVALRAIDLGLTLHFPLHRSGREYPVEGNLNEYWKTVEDKIAKEVDERLNNLAPHDFLAFMHWFNRHDMPVGKLFEWYKPYYLFFEQKSVVFENLSRWSIAERIFINLPGFDAPVEQQIPERLNEANKIAADIGKMLLKISLPCFSSKELSFWRGITGSSTFLLRHSRTWAKSEEIHPVRVPITADAMFGSWCLYAVSAEITGKPENFIKQVERSHIPIIKAIFDSIKARMHMITTDKALQSLSKFNLSQTALEFVERWITGQVSFVQESHERKT